MQKQTILLCVDLVLIPVAMLLALGLWAGSPASMTEQFIGMSRLVLLMMLAGGVISYFLELPRIKLNAYEFQGILRTCMFAALVGIFGAIAWPTVTVLQFSANVLIVFTMALTIGSVAARLIMHRILLRIYLGSQQRQRVLIYGAGRTGSQLATALLTDGSVEPVALVDDNPTLQRMMIAGLPVYPPQQIDKLVREKKIGRVVLAMPSVSAAKQAQIARRLQLIGCEVRALPSFASLVSTKPLLDQIRPVNPGDYLNRSGVEAELVEVSGIYADASVLITGAGGTIGSELSLQILACAPRQLVLFDVSELALYQIERELKSLPMASRTTIVPVLGSVTDEQTIKRTMEAYDVRVVLHAAAYKHVPMVERNQLVGLRNNVMGTRIVAEAARDAGVSHFVLISTDKAVRPTNVMGASKRLAELVVQDISSRTEATKFSIVRFGNVLGSSGSVVPLFEEQIAHGGPVTLTHKEVTRYFMTVGEAARLVLVAGASALGSDVFVLDMGSPVSIRRLARQMIERAGCDVKDAENPDGDIEIVITGLRPGEKLHEELMLAGDLVQTPHPKILRAQDPTLSEIEMATALRDLKGAIENGDETAAREVISRWVDGYSDSVAKQELANETQRQR